jgi:hypothetical protein
VVQLCHPDLHNDFPPLRSPSPAVSHNLPVQLTSFIGRRQEMKNLREALGSNRLVTLTGAGGAGKTRLAVHAATELAGEFGDGVCYVDLAPITHPDGVAGTAARALGLPDQPGRSTMDTLLRFIRDRHILMVLDNCEHLLDASARLVVALLGGAPRLTMLATSREPIGLKRWRRFSRRSYTHGKTVVPPPGTRHSVPSGFIQAWGGCCAVCLAVMGGPRGRGRGCRVGAAHRYLTPVEGL